MDLQQILSIPDFKRDDKWEKSFFSAFVKGSLEIVEDIPKTGPDGWPYLMVKTSEDGDEPTSQILSWLTERGVGLVINAHKSTPDYIFTYGMIWNFRETGAFITQVPPRTSGPVVIEAAHKLFSGPPTAAFFPPYVAKVFSEFLKNVGVLEPKILVVGSDSTGYDLCFSIESLGVPPEAEHEGILKSFAWFFPAHYSLMLVSERQMPKFHLIKDL